MTIILLIEDEKLWIIRKGLQETLERIGIVEMKTDITIRDLEREMSQLRHIG